VWRFVLPGMAENRALPNAVLVRQDGSLMRAFANRVLQEHFPAAQGLFLVMLVGLAKYPPPDLSRVILARPAPAVKCRGVLHLLLLPIMFAASIAMQD
jgi:hypothetical protein